MAKKRLQEIFDNIPKSKRSTMKECLGLFGKIFGHRYTTVYATDVEGEESDAYHITSGKRTKTPVSTYCSRCGDKIPLDSK